MADSLQMMDLVSLSKNLNQLRGTDPEQRAAAHRLAGAATAREFEELQRDVTETEETREARLRQRRDREGSGKEQHESRRERSEEPPEPVPEQTEGHLLNLKV